MSGSARGGIASKGGSPQGEPIDLDMTPMMNMLIILISFLVTMVVFTHLAVIRFDLPPAVAGGGEAAADTGSQAQDADITVVITENGFQIMSEGRKRDPVPAGGKGYDYAGLGQAMKKLKAEYPSARNVVLLIDSTILYQDIITAMDVCRESDFPDILLSGGFSQ
jgi:biopolymer transport protein ExbD